MRLVTFFKIMSDDFIVAFSKLSTLILSKCCIFKNYVRCCYCGDKFSKTNSVPLLVAMNFLKLRPWLLSQCLIFQTKSVNSIRALKF